MFNYFFLQKPDMHKFLKLTNKILGFKKSIRYCGNLWKVLCFEKSDA